MTKTQIFWATITLVVGFGVFRDQGEDPSPFLVPVAAPPPIFPDIDQTVPVEGDRLGRFIVTQGWNGNHMGIDVALPNWEDPTGSPIYAVGFPGGEVEVRCWFDPVAGLTASTYAEGMDFAFDYAHIETCVAGQQGTTTVQTGQRIATIGNSGANTTGAHLHFQQRQNGTADPTTGRHLPGWAGYLFDSLN